MVRVVPADFVATNSSFLSTISIHSQATNPRNFPNKILSDFFSSSQMEESSNPELSSKESRNWLDLPRDVTSTILLKLGAIEILTSAQNVCSSWRKLCKDPSMWRFIDFHNTGDPDANYDIDVLAQHAVDRSCGELEGINVEHYGTDDFLKYITDRCCHIRRLRFAFCYSISAKVLSEVALKLPLLEELDLSYGSFSNEALVGIGRSCPLLKSFKFNSHGFRRPHIDCDEEAFAIAQTMPGLRQLHLFGNRLTNDGLFAILEGCPHLELLDLRQCYNVILTGEEERCIEHIKDMRYPYDPVGVNEFDAEIYSCNDDLRDEDLSEDEDYPPEFSDFDFMSDDGYDYEFYDSDEEFVD